MPARPIARVIAVLVCLASAEAAAAPATFTFPPGGVLKSVLITNTTPCAGRQVLIAVNAQDPEHPTGPVEIYIDGAPGTPQALQYFAVNPARKISIFAITPSRLQDRKEITISVQSCPEVTTTLELLHSRNPYRRDHVDFHAVLRGGTARAYFWQFGDGTTATTREPFVSHDYSAAMEQQDKFTYFNASVTATGPGLISTRRIAIGSSFAMSRSMGFIQADVKHTLTPTGQGFVVGYQIRNHHGTPITFRQYLKQYLPCDYRQPTTIQAVAAETVLGTNPAIGHPPGAPTPGDLTIRGGTGATGRLVLRQEQIPPETCALGFTLIGESEDRKPAYGNFYVKVRQNPRFTTPVANARTLAALEYLDKNNLVPNADEITAEQLYLLEQRGFIERTRNGWRKK
jgi:hypothetical protein